MITRVERMLARTQQDTASRPRSAMGARQSTVPKPRVRRGRSSMHVRQHERAARRDRPAARLPPALRERHRLRRFCGTPSPGAQRARRARPRSALSLTKVTRPTKSPRASAVSDGPSAQPTVTAAKHAGILTLETVASWFSDRRWSMGGLAEKLLRRCHRHDDGARCRDVNHQRSSCGLRSWRSLSSRRCLTRATAINPSRSSICTAAWSIKARASCGVAPRAASRSRPRSTPASRTASTISFRDARRCPGRCCRRLMR